MRGGYDDDNNEFNQGPEYFTSYSTPSPSTIRGRRY